MPRSSLEGTTLGINTKEITIVRSTKITLDVDSNATRNHKVFSSSIKPIIFHYMFIDKEM
jgi:hypothetical protein